MSSYMIFKIIQARKSNFRTGYLPLSNGCGFRSIPIGVNLRQIRLGMAKLRIWRSCS